MFEFANAVNVAGSEYDRGAKFYQKINILIVNALK